jgi:hypothetical protein
MKNLKRKYQLEDLGFDKNETYIKEVEQKGVDWNRVVPSKD